MPEITFSLLLSPTRPPARCGRSLSCSFLCQASWLLGMILPGGRGQGHTSSEPLVGNVASLLLLMCGAHAALFRTIFFCRAHPGAAPEWRPAGKVAAEVWSQPHLQSPPRPPASTVTESCCLEGGVPEQRGPQDGCGSVGLCTLWQRTRDPRNGPGTWKRVLPFLFIISSILAGAWREGGSSAGSHLTLTKFTPPRTEAWPPCSFCSTTLLLGAVLRGSTANLTQPF